MRILVTGATGFIGESLISKLIKEGHEIIATSRDEENAKTKSWYHSVKFVPFIIGESHSDDYLAFFHTPDMVIHTAWDKLHDYKGLHHIEETVFKHYHFIKQLIVSGIDNISVLGTCFEYGMVEGKMSEEMIPVPFSNYGIAKNTLRIFLEALAKQHPFQLKWIRLFYNYGKATNSNSLFAQLDKAIEQKELQFNLSPGDQLRDYMEFDELLSTIIRISTQQRVTGVINCCSGQPIRVLDLVHQLIKEKNSSIQLNLGFYPYSELEPKHFWGDTLKLKSI